MTIKNVFKLSILLIPILITSCSTKTSTNINGDQYVGVWKMKIKKLPKVGDVSFTMNIKQKDSLYTGFFIEEDGDTVNFSKILIEDGYMDTRYSWDGHDVGFKVKVDDNNKAQLKGTFMRFFDIEGTKES